MRGMIKNEGRSLQNRLISRVPSVGAPPFFAMSVTTEKGAAPSTNHCPLIPALSSTVRLWDEPFPRTNKTTPSPPPKETGTFIYLFNFH
jgi:hypothetical protein